MFVIVFIVDLVVGVVAIAATLGAWIRGDFQMAFTTLGVVALCGINLVALLD